jgi:hypothetical protein
VATLAKALPWLNSLEDLALQALAPDLDVELFDAELMKAALPEDLPVPLPVADDTVPLGTPEGAFIVWSVAPDAPDAPVEKLLQEAMVGRRAASAAWMTGGGETVAPSVAICGGFISGTQYCAMLDGRWSEHAWTVAARDSYCDPISRGVDFIGAPGKSAEDPQSSAIPSSEERTAMDTKSE